MKYTHKININSSPHSYTLYYTKSEVNIYIKILKNEFVLENDLSDDLINFLIERKWTEENLFLLRDKFYNNKSVSTIFIK